MDQQDDSPIDFSCSSGGSIYFDEVIGHIEDIVLGVEFETLHQNFLEKHWHYIEDTEENKLEYMEIFSKYSTLFENFFMQELSSRMPNFDMHRFTEELEANNANLTSFENCEILELLHSFTNFETFKGLILDYRNKKEGNVQHLDFDILITKPMSMEYQEPNAEETLQNNIPM